jgi:hypothetical protein
MLKLSDDQETIDWRALVRTKGCKHVLRNNPDENVSSLSSSMTSEYAEVQYWHKVRRHYKEKLFQDSAGRWPKSRPYRK